MSDTSETAEPGATHDAGVQADAEHRGAAPVNAGTESPFDAPEGEATVFVPVEEQVVEFKRAIESIVLVAHTPVPPELLAQLIEQPTSLVEQWCEELAESYIDAQHGFELVRVAGGFRYQTAANLMPYVERFLLHDQRSRLSGAALETLAIVAYKQPISRAQVGAIRGVDPDGVLRTLQARGYIDEVGRDDGPGQAILFGTTETFLEKLGIDSLDDLPAIAEFIPGADVVELLEHGLRVTPEIDVAPSAVVTLPAEVPGGIESESNGSETVETAAVETAAGGSHGAEASNAGQNGAATDDASEAVDSAGADADDS